jgi:hypothetical protein
MAPEVTSNSKAPDWTWLSLLLSLPSVLDGNSEICIAPPDSSAILSVACCKNLFTG